MSDEASVKLLSRSEEKIHQSPTEKQNVRQPQQKFEMVVGHVCERRVSHDASFANATEVRPDSEILQRQAATGAVLFESKGSGEYAEKISMQPKQKSFDMGRRKPTARPPAFERVSEKPANGRIG